MRNFDPAALAMAQDLYKEDHFRIIIEKNRASVKLRPKKSFAKWITLLGNLWKYINYDININKEDPKMFNGILDGCS